MNLLVGLKLYVSKVIYISWGILLFLLDGSVDLVESDSVSLRRHLIFYQAEQSDASGID